MLTPAEIGKLLSLLHRPLQTELYTSLFRPKIMAASNSVKETGYSNQVEVNAITKCSIGKLIVKYCGNEGKKDDESLVVTRRTILQTVITQLDNETEETWRNAEIVIYDQLGNDFCIRSGKAENKFVVQLDGKDNVHISCTQRGYKSFFMTFTSWLPSLRKTDTVCAIEPSTNDANAESVSQLNDMDTSGTQKQNYLQWLIPSCLQWPKTGKDETGEEAAEAENELESDNDID